ncbi:MAG: aspartyl/asparaginyl beta-hydroxylase domain-containing protein [Betaproteobacteria bacterium]
MQTPTLDARVLAQSATAALQRGDALSARTTFQRIAAAGLADASAFLGLAYSCHALKDQQAALVAVNSALALEPRNLRALIFKGDQLAMSGDRHAASFYQTAVKAAPPAEQLPPDLREEMKRAQSLCNRFAGEFAAYLREQLGKDAAGGTSRRLAQSIEILAGVKQLYFQEPRYYYFPELPQIQFYDRNDFPWLDKVEAATGEIRDELLAIMQRPADFQPYVQDDPGRPWRDQQGLLNNPDWSAFYLWKDGEVIAENAARCPRTLMALADVPLTRVKNRSPSILFSLLRPGARIPPHTGMLNTRLICHLPLIVPGNCGFRVGNEIREWVEGKAWLFDDTMEHEAWNLSDQTRVILLFEIWRPELSAAERRQLCAMFEAIDSYTGEKTDWDI